MSNNIVQNTKYIISNPSIKNTRPVYMEVLVDILSVSNRPTFSEKTNKYLKEGFDWNEWVDPCVARLPDNQLFIYDGDHRKHMFKIAFPEATHMPASVRDVSSMEEVHNLFNLANKEHISVANAEQCYVNSVKANNSEALKLETKLKNCKLAVSLGTGEAESYVGSPDGFHSTQPVTTKVVGFTKTIARCGDAATEAASKLIQENWRAEVDSGKGIPVELMEGFATILNLPGSKKITGKSNPKLAKAFTKWLESNRACDLKAFHKSLKKLGGEVNNKGGTCTAKGILIALKSWSSSYTDPDTDAKYYTTNAWGQAKLKEELEDKIEDLINPPPKPKK